MPEHSHRYEFGAPRGGWPRFGPDGTRIREEEGEPARCPSCGEVVATASAGTHITEAKGASGQVPVDGEAVHACGVSAE